MSAEWPAPSRHTRRQTTLKGCMGALPQMFQWSRVLGSNNKCIATPAAPSVPSEKQTEWTKQAKSMVLHHPDGLEQLAAAVSNESGIGSSRVWKVTDSSVSQETLGMDLRHVLYAKQEPFVLQDVIREKRQPMRTPSSRELKFGVPPTRRSAKMKNSTSSKDQEQATEDGYSAACWSQYCVAPKTPTCSAAVVRRNRVPVESMVAMPSHQAPAVFGVNSATKAHSNAASLGRNPVKSPNKRALLMEAAARILEGSNRRTSKRPSTSVRSLLEELERSKHVKELPKSKEKLVRVVAFSSESSEVEEVLSPNVVILGERAAESKQYQNSYDLKLSGKHSINSSCNHHFEMSQIVEDILVMANKRFPYDNDLDEAEGLPSLATPVQNPALENKSECVQLHDDLWSGMEGNKQETTNQSVKGFKLSSSKVLLQAKTGAVPIVLPEMTITEDQRPELDYDAHFKDRKAIMPSTSRTSAADFLPVITILPCLPNFDYRAPSQIRSVFDYSLARHLIWGYHAAAPFLVDSPEKCEGSCVRSTGRSCLIEGADETEYNYRSRDKFEEAGRQSSFTQLRLCNYSWWGSCQNNSSENQLLTEYCDGYDSPVNARCSYFGKVWTEEMNEEEASAYVYPVDQFQQASPVSVLEPVYEEEFQLANTFDNFEEARQKLLEKVRQYEMLAHMDVDMLKKVSEDHVSHVWDDNELRETDYNYSCSSSGSCASDSSFQASPAHDFSSSDVEAQDSSRRFMKEPYIFVQEEQSLYGQEVEMWPTSSGDCLTEKLELRPISCRALQSQRIVSGHDHIKGVVGKRNSNFGQSVVAYVVNSLLHKEVTMSNWSSSKQEEEAEVEVELERCFFEVLMCELLSDLLKAQFKPFCSAFDPLHHQICNL